MKQFLFIFFIFLFLGNIPLSVWNNLNDNSKQDIARAYALMYLEEKEYCSEVTIEITPMENTVEVTATCDKLKI